MVDNPEDAPQRSKLFPLFFAALTAGFAYAFIVINGEDHLWSGLTFLMLLPVLIGALLSFATPLEYQKHFRSIFGIQFALFGGLIIFFALIMDEGVICILMLVIPWLIFGMLGSFLTYLIRRRIRRKGQFFSLGLILLPVLGLQIESMLPTPDTEYQVDRYIDIDAAPSLVWPHLLSIQNIGTDEGQWNFAQDVLAIPRPTSAVLIGRGVGAIRHAKWGQEIRFEEHITAWQPGVKINWAFHFPDKSIAKHTDRHISPDSDLLTIQTGGYHLQAIGPNRTRLKLTTKYRTRSWSHSYSALWGGFYLGSIQNNILSVVKGRVEKPDI